MRLLAGTSSPLWEAAHAAEGASGKCSLNLAMETAARMRRGWPEVARLGCSMGVADRIHAAGSSRCPGQTGVAAGDCFAVTKGTLVFAGHIGLALAPSLAVDQDKILVGCCLHQPVAPMDSAGRTTVVGRELG